MLWRMMVGIERYGGGRIVICDYDPDRFEDDIAGYRNAKGPFLESVLVAARAEEGMRPV
jgi:hypothetical protein